MKGYYAFWKYDLYPFVLGGRIEKMREDGCVQTTEYGPGHWFSPLKILPEGSGRKMLDALRMLTDENRKAKKKFDAEWKDKVTLLMGAVDG